MLMSVPVSVCAGVAKERSVRGTKMDERKSGKGSVNDDQINGTLAYRRSGRLNKLFSAVRWQRQLAKPGQGRMRQRSAGATGNGQQTTKTRRERRVDKRDPRHSLQRLRQKK